MLGKSIDGLLNKEYHWIGVFLFIESLSNFFIYKRMVFDTKIYTSIYNDIVFNYLDSSEDSDVSTRLGRTDLAHSIVDFLEHHIHYYIMSILSIIGTLFFIFMSHVVTGFIVLLCAPFICFIVWKFYGKIAQSTKISHNQHEKKMDVLNTNDRGLIDSFFAKALLPESLERFNALLTDPEKIVTVDTLGEIAGWLTEQYSGRPQQGPEQSASGQ